MSDNATNSHIDASIDDYLDGALDARARHRVEAHCAACAACAHQLSKAVYQKKMLAAMPAPTPSRPLSDFIHEAVLSAEKHEQRAGASRGKASIFPILSGLWAQGSHWRPALAMALMLALVALFVRLPANDGGDIRQIAIGSEVKNVRLAIDSKQALKGVRLRIELSDNLALNGFGSRRTLEWTTSLKKGANVISLPIVGLAAGEGSIVTRIQLGDREKRIEIHTLNRPDGNVLNMPTGNAGVA